jgi:carboxypeptidase C (cathepsin A)
LIKFYEKFPNLKKNNLFLSGESYAGVYVPFLARSIIQYNKLPSRQMTVNFKGFMVNNACTDPNECYVPRMAHSNSIYQY